eukprot:g16645.t1
MPRRGHQGCTKIPSYGKDGTRTAEFCYKHKKDGMVDVVSKSYGVEGSANRGFCNHHADDGMVNLSRKSRPNGSVTGHGGLTPAGRSAGGHGTARRAAGRKRKGSAIAPSPSIQTEASSGRSIAGTAGNKRVRQGSDGVAVTRASIETAVADESGSLAEADSCFEPDEAVIKAELGILSKVDPKGEAEFKAEASAAERATVAEGGSCWEVDASVDTKVEASFPLLKGKSARER